MNIDQRRIVWTIRFDALMTAVHVQAGLYRSDLTVLNKFPESQTIRELAAGSERDMCRATTALTEWVKSNPYPQAEAVR